MREAKGAAQRMPASKKVVSRAEALWLMIAAGVAGVATTAAAVSDIVAYFAGPVTLTLPLAATHHDATGLRLGATAHFASVEATIPVLPNAEATLLAWAGVLNLIGILAVLSLLFVLAFRLRGENLFTVGSVWIIGACGVVLALAGTLGQALDSAARHRVAQAIGANQGGAGESIIFSANFNVGPLMAGFVLILVAAVFQFGGRLQKDTEGLV
jgi:hypothetical protein